MYSAIPIEHVLLPTLVRAARMLVSGARRPPLSAPSRSCSPVGVAPGPGVSMALKTCSADCRMLTVVARALARSMISIDAFCARSKISTSLTFGLSASDAMLRRSRIAHRFAQLERIESAYARAWTSLTVDAAACSLRSASIPVASRPFPSFAACVATATGSCSTAVWPVSSFFARQASIASYMSPLLRS